ncbi:metallophosphoesterase [Mycobacterium sp. NPDC050441]|uniref:metallophosphoesterase n=1 Tax=Mycobacterium sp. NPDC050441 TaxID=3155403 RepID=UPI0033BFEAB7
MIQYGFVGDIHGCIRQLHEVIGEAKHIATHLVFLGDYVNRGAHSREVIEYLVELNKEIPSTFLSGNHDQSLLRSLEGPGFDEFLRMGGASTVRSYIEALPQPDVLSQFRSSVPPEHLIFLNNLQPIFDASGVFATHELTSLGSARSKFQVCGHAPRPTITPLISDRAALIDTGCGTLSGGRLTCFFWPSRQWIQSTPWDE